MRCGSGALYGARLCAQRNPTGGARPVGYIEITDEGTRFVEVSTVRKMIAAAFLGFVAGYLFCGRKSRS